MNDYEYEVWGDPELAAYATLLGAEPEPPMLLAAPAAPSDSDLFEVMESDGQWVPEYKTWCDVHSVGKTYPLPARKWLTIGNAALRGEEFVFSADGPADGYIATKVTVPAGSHFRMSFEAGYYGNRTNSYGTTVAFKVAAAIDNVPVVSALHEEPADGPKDHRRPRGFAFEVPGEGDVEVELRFHDLTDRDGAARDLRIMPQVAVAVGRVSTPVIAWKDDSGTYDKRYYSTRNARSTLYRVRGDIEKCGEVADCKPSYRSGVMCDRWWDLAAKKWQDETITVWSEIPCEGLFIFTYEKGGNPTERGTGEPYELNGHIVDCDIPEPPDPSECPTDEFYSCRDITSTGTTTFTRHVHTPCDGDPVDRKTFGGAVYQPAGLVRCDEVDTIEEARKREGKADCPTGKVFSCKDVLADKTVTHTKWVITGCDGKTEPEPVRTYKGLPYTLQGEEKDCVEVENRKQAEEEEKTQTCPVTHAKKLCDRRTMWVLQDGWKLSEGVTGPDANGYFALGADEPGGDFIETTVTPEKPGGTSWFNFRTLALGEGSGDKRPYVRFKVEVFDGDERIYSSGVQERTGTDYKTVGYPYTAPATGDVRVRLTDITTAEDASKGELVGLRVRPHGQERKSEYEFLRHVTTLCDGTKEPAGDTTVHGQPYVVQGQVGKCGECGTSSKWYTCLDGNTRYVREEVYDCHGELVETHRTLHDKTYKPSTDPEDCTEVSEAEAKRRQGEVECPNRSEWSNCTDYTPTGTVVYSREKVFDCNGKHITTNRTFQGSTYKHVNGQDCVDRASEEDARKHEGKNPCPKTRKNTCTEVKRKKRGTAYFKKWLNSLAITRASTGGPDFANEGIYYRGGRPLLRGRYRWDYQFNYNAASSTLSLVFDDPVFVEFDATGLAGNEYINIPEGFEPVKIDTGAHEWDEDRRRIGSKNPHTDPVRYHDPQSMAVSRFRSVKPVEKLVLNGSRYGQRYAKYLAITNLTLFTAESKQTITKIVTTDCHGKETKRYERNGDGYEPTGPVVDCRPS